MRRGLDCWDEEDEGFSKGREVCDRGRDLCVFSCFNSHSFSRDDQVFITLSPRLLKPRPKPANYELFSRQLEVNNLDLSSVRASLYRFILAVAAKTLMMEVTLSIPRSRFTF